MVQAGGCRRRRGGGRGRAGGRPVVMSSEAFGHYQVAGPPFLVLAGAESVRTESVAWGVEQTLRIAVRALDGD